MFDSLLVCGTLHFGMTLSDRESDLVDAVTERSRIVIQFTTVRSTVYWQYLPHSNGWLGTAVISNATEWFATFWSRFPDQVKVSWIGRDLFPERLKLSVLEERKFLY